MTRSSPCCTGMLQQWPRMAKLVLLYPKSFEKSNNVMAVVFPLTAITFYYLKTPNGNTVKTDLWSNRGVKTEEKMGHKVMKSHFVCLGVAPSSVQHALRTVVDYNNQNLLLLNLRHREEEKQSQLTQVLEKRSHRLLLMNRNKFNRQHSGQGCGTYCLDSHTCSKTCLPSWLGIYFLVHF